MEKIKGYQEDSEVQKNHWWILVSVTMFTFVSTLDFNIVNITSPTISREMSIPMDQVERIVSTYLVIICACLLLSGRTGNSFGKIKVYRIGVVAFTTSSLPCDFDRSLSFLLFTRVIQSIDVSMIMTTNSGIITEAPPLNERRRVLDVVGVFVSLGTIAGPGIGGLVLSGFPWLYILWINVPVGLVIILIGERFLLRGITETKEEADFSGLVCIAIAIMTFPGGTFPGQKSGFGLLQSCLLFIIVVATLGLFVMVKQERKSPLTKFAIFRNKAFALGSLSAILVFASNFFVNVVTPPHLQSARKLNASYADLLMMVFPLLMVVGAPLSDYLADKISSGILASGGLLLLCCMSLIYMFLDINSPIWYYVIATVIIGLGDILLQSPDSTTAVSSVEKQDLGVAGSINSFARNLGVVTGATLSATISYHGMSEAYGERVATYLANRPNISIVGMHEIFLVTFPLCATVFILTTSRFRKTTK